MDGLPSPSPVTHKLSLPLWCSPRVQQMAVLALLSTYDNAHNEGVVRSTGTLKCILRMA